MSKKIIKRIYNVVIILLFWELSAGASAISIMAAMWLIPMMHR